MKTSSLDSFWGGPGCNFRAFWEPWGRSWGVLAASWGVLGGLRPAWFHFCRFKLNKVQEGRPKASKKGPNMGPKMGAKTDQNRCQKRSRKKKLLKIVLEPSWVDLGSSWVPSWGQNRALALGGARFFENRLFGENEGSTGDLGRT